MTFNPILPAMTGCAALVLLGCTPGNRGTMHSTVHSSRLATAEAPAMLSARASHAAGMVDGSVVTAGGSSWSADKKTKSWHADASVFRDGAWRDGPALPHPAVDSIFASDGHTLCVAGGMQSAEVTSAEAHCLRATSSTLAWHPLPPLPAPRTAGGGAMLEGRFYIACGAVDGKPTADLLMLDVDHNGPIWQTLPPLPADPRMYPAMVAVGSQLYVIGGMSPDANAPAGLRAFRDIHRFDPHSRTWTRLADLPAAGYGWSAAAVNDHSILLAGRADGAIHDDAWLVTLPDGLVRRVGTTLVQTACAPLVRVTAKKWWLIGGEPASQVRTGRVSEFTLPE